MIYSYNLNILKKKLENNLIIKEKNVYLSVSTVLNLVPKYFALRILIHNWIFQ